MEITIGSKINHTKSGEILTVTKITPKTYVGKSNGFLVTVKKVDCVPYTEPKKEKSFLEILKEGAIERAKKLSPSPVDVPQHILHLKGAAVERIETLDNRLDENVYTFSAGNGPDRKFGFSEQYVNLLLHIAYEAGKKDASDVAASTVKSLRNVIDSIVNTLDDNDLLPSNENY